MGQGIKVVSLHPGYRVNGRLVKKIASGILKHCRLRGDADLDVVFLTDREIRALNKRYKGEPRATDVLAFDLRAGETRPNPSLPYEIFISIDRARKNAAIFGTTLTEEAVLYLIHGILHLNGYDDGTGRERLRMEKKQKRMLRDLCKREDLSKVLTRR